MKFERRDSRRGIAGIVATVIMFAILFTVGTSYFIFIGSENASYVSSLLKATNNVQGTLQESLSVTTTLESDGDVGFYVNNTSSVTVNMTAVLVISSTGALLKCDGIGFPVGAGCGNTTPSLWAVVNAGYGSSTYDTGYVYVAGTTDTVKVLTARGNNYAASYPEPASQSGSSQSVTVNLDNLRWIQLVPEASALVQKSYVANCNSANCALAYSSSVTAGNILVDAVGWASNAPPSGVPTDTRGDLFSLGASSSVAVSASPAVVQEKYTSNCNAATCGLAFTSSVTAGHELVYAVGWANQAAPTAPTDTRGDSFTLGASNSVTVGAANPSIVQHKYLSNCNSATCALAYTSSVTAANTLVDGLGWYSSTLYEYIPITITNNQASATPNPFQQMVTWDPATYSAYEATNLGNVRFCADTVCNTPLDAWLESCSSTCNSAGSSSTSATAWVKLTSAIAANGGTLTIYMVFESTSTQFDGNYWGEAPQLSSTYAQYDNGANVFAAYFNGDTATGDFTVYTGLTLAQATGVTGPTGGTINVIAITNNPAAHDPFFSFNTALSNTGLIVESSYAVAADTNDGTGVGGLVNSATANSITNGIAYGEGFGSDYFYQASDTSSAMTEPTNGAGASPAAGTWLYGSLTYTGSSEASFYAQITPALYGTPGQSAGTGYSGTDTLTNPISGATHVYMGSIGGSSAVDIEYNFMRARYYPPSDVMPSAAFGNPAGNAAPTLSDTLGDSFTLGASSSVAGGASTPALVQHRYASNCNSASCGLAYSSSVTAGNMLVFGLGWFGATAPSTPTDTLGDAFTLGASNSVENGATASLAIDGSNSQESGSASSISTTLTTSNTNDLIIAYVSPVEQASNNPPTVSSISGGGLTWHSRETGAIQDGGEYYQNVDEWYAVASSTLSSATITATLSGTANQEVWITVFGISGVNTANPFDPNGSVPATDAATNNPSTTMSTSNANDMLIYACSPYDGGNPNGWTSVEANGGYSIDEYVAYQTVTSTQSNLVTSCGGNNANGAEVTDAVEGAATYNSYIWYATAASSGADTITASFGSAVTGSVSIYEISGVAPALTSFGSSSSAGATSSVSSITPSSSSVVIGNTETASTTLTAGTGYTLAGTCSSVYGCGEYETGVGSATTVPMSLSPSAVWVESAMTFEPSTKTYYSYIYYATAGSSGADTITATFSASVQGTVSIYEVNGVTTSGTLSSTGSSSAGSTSASVGSFTPSSNSFVIGNVEGGSATTTFTVGSGYTLAGTCSSVEGCGEYEAGLGTATTTPFTLSASTPWVDVALSFSPLPASTYYSYIYYATAASSGADTISASFGSTVAGSVSIYEISGVTATGLLTSTGGSSSAQASTSVSSVTPNLAGSVVIGNSETPSTTYTGGSGYTLSGSCNTVTGCGEYETGVGTATTVPMSISPSEPWVEAAVVFAPTVTNYYSYIWYATAATSGADTITTAFGSTVAGSVSIYEITDYTTSGALSSTGSSSTGSTTAAVTSYTPATDSFIVGNAEAASATTHYTASSGFTLGGTCTSVEGCSEYDSSSTDGGSANTVPITLGASSPWVEASMSFSTPFNPQSGIQVGGYPTMGVPSGANIVWEVTFTNVDPLHRTITIWPQTEMAIGSAEFDGFDIDYQQAHYYIISGLNSGSTTVNPYTTSGFITLAYNIPTTLYFAATAALGSTTQAFGTNVLTPFEAYFALSGIMSDGTLFGETIPYPYGIITDANAYTTPTAGSTGATITVSCTSPCDFTDSAAAAVGWINSAGQMTALTTFTMTASGNIPSGVTFQVPTATAGYYTIVVTDYTNSVFMTFQHT